MKRNFVTLKFALVFGILTVLAIFVTKPAASQEPAKTEPHKKITVKIVTDDKGKKTVIDTTMIMPDSSMTDSLMQMVEKEIEVGHGGHHLRYKIKNMPEGFDYHFDMPCMPDCAMKMEGLEDLDMEGMADGREREDFIWDGSEQGCSQRMMTMRGNRQTLSDVIGDIPMDRVTNYSVKETKHGKRITIDVENGPLFEKRDQRVIVIREPGMEKQHQHSSQHKVKVYVNTDKEPQVENGDKMPEAPETTQPAKKVK